MLTSASFSERFEKLEADMKKIVLAFAMLMSLWGCSNDNKLTIQNMAQCPIYINFLGTVDSVFSGESYPVNNIPNGTYQYSTTYAIPNNVTSSSVSGDAASGQLIFEKNNTKVLLLYSSTTLTGVYTLSATQSSSDPVSATSPTSTQ